MFHPTVFRTNSTPLPSEKDMEIEAYVFSILVQSDRAHVAAMADSALALLLVDDNANALHHLVWDKPSHPVVREDWDLLTPDWSAVRQHLGEIATEQWQTRIADQIRQATSACDVAPSAAA
jgi:hypothetical protein